MERTFLIAYDIREPKRLIRVHRFLKSHAVALQYSLFVLTGTEACRRDVELGLRELIDPARDDVRIYALPADVVVRTMGAADPLPNGVVLVDAAGVFAVGVDRQADAPGRD